MSIVDLFSGRDPNREAFHRELSQENALIARQSLALRRALPKEHRRLVILFENARIELANLRYHVKDFVYRRDYHRRESDVASQHMHECIPVAREKFERKLQYTISLGIRLADIAKKYGIDMRLQIASSEELKDVNRMAKK